uniref:Uncharacterized protein n=1 Tax=Salix viminalis TaxID=40686 RepID=A0A6N2MUD7_SALVM
MVFYHFLSKHERKPFFDDYSAASLRSIVEIINPLCNFFVKSLLDFPSISTISLTTLPFPSSNFNLIFELRRY